MYHSTKLMKFYLYANITLFSNEIESWFIHGMFGQKWNSADCILQSKFQVNVVGIFYRF